MTPFIEYLDQAKIEAQLSQENKQRLSRLDIFETIESTNTYLLTHAKAYDQSGCVCLAEEQSSGRGRQGKPWFSPKGSNIYCSLLWKFPTTQTNISHLSLAVAVMLIQALQRYGIHQGLQLKWPNDIYFANRKLAGILIEAIPSQAKEYPVVIGIGLNLHLPKDNPYTQDFSALEEITGRKIARNQLAGLLIDELLTQLPRYTTHGFSAFIAEWRKHDMLQNKSVVIRTGQQQIMGIAESINEEGELIIRDKQGKTQSFSCGEVSVRLCV